MKWRKILQRLAEEYQIKFSCTSLVFLVLVPIFPFHSFHSMSFMYPGKVSSLPVSSIQHFPPLDKEQPMILLTLPGCVC